MTPKFLQRTIYLGYYLKKLDRIRFNKFFKHVKEIKGYSSLYLYYDMLKCVYLYNIGIIDYFVLRFYEKNPEERKLWIGTGYKYEYDLLMNPDNRRHILENKIDFYKAYEPFVRHAVCTLEDIQMQNARARKVLENSTGKIVIKDSLGQCGWEVEILQMSDFNYKAVYAYMQKKGFNLAEEYIIQHPALAELSDSGVNTVRVITQLNNQDTVDFLGARLRISVNNHVDNLASGNIAAVLDLETGRVSGPGVFSDITEGDVTFHPVSGIELIGFQVPFWQNILDLTRNAALYRPENRSIGWDVVITEEGPELLEGNHNWCKILWQLPLKKGLKPVLEKYKNDFISRSHTV